MLTHQISHIVEYRNVREQRAKLEKHPHASTHGIQFIVTHLRNGLPIDQQLPTGWLQLPADQAQEGCFPAPRVPHDRHQFPARNLHIDSFEDRAIIVSKVDVSDFDQAIRRHASIPRQNRTRIIP